MSSARFVTFALGLVPWSLRGHIKSIPGVAAAQRALVSNALDGKEFDHLVDAGPAKGVTFPVRMPEDKGIWTGAYEKAFASRLAEAVVAGDVTYDIGSWHGFFAGVMSAQGARHVHVFEPLPVNAERIRKLIALNPSRSITLHGCAVGESDGMMNLMIMPETSMAKLETSEFQADQTSQTKVRVAVRSLDSIVANGEAPPPGLMKIDVEGAEVLVLKGAIDTIRRYHPVIFAEVHSSDLLAEVRRLLQDEGYAIEHLDEDEAVARAKDVFQIRAVAA